MIDVRGRRAWQHALAFGTAIVLTGITWARIDAFARLRPRAWVYTYPDLAQQILQGRIPYDTIRDVSPVYLWLTVLLRAGGIRELGVAAMQITMVTLAAVFCAIAAKRIAGWWGAAAALVLVLGNHSAWIIATELDPKTLIFFLTAAAFALLPPRDSTSRAAAWRLALAGLCLGLSAVTHPYGYLILAVVVLFHRRWALTTALLPIVLVPVVYAMFLPANVAGHSSTQFYEGNNPLATGAGGVAPRVVRDLQADLRVVTADPIYRMIGADWGARARAFHREYPGAAFARYPWKALLTVHNYSVWDVASTSRKSEALARYPAIPFGAVFLLAVAALVLRRSRRDLALYATVAAMLIVVLTIFVVSARQRNVLLVPLAILGGAGVAELVALVRARSERSLLVFGAVLIGSAFLGIEGAPMRENAYKWTPRAELDDPMFVFDRARALALRGQWAEADALFASIEDYRPMRENRDVSSVAYHRARLALKRGATPAMVRALLDRAEHEAPGDPYLLALRALTFDGDARRRLDALHDPYTRDLALAVALADLGRRAEALRLLADLQRRLPAWRRPQYLSASLLHKGATDTDAKGHASRTSLDGGSRKEGR